MADDVASIGVKMDTSGVDSGIKSLEALAQQGPKVEQAMAGVERVVKTTGRTLESLRQSAPDLSGVANGAARAGAALGGLSDSTRTTIKSSDDLRRAVESLTTTEEKHIRKLMEEAKTIGMGRGDREAYLAQSRGMSTSAQEVARALGAKVEALKVEQSAMASAAKSAQEMTTANYGLAAAMQIAVRGAQAMLGLQVVGWAKDATAAMFQASAAAERLRIGMDFASMRGSAEEIGYLRKTTYDLGLSFASTATAYQQFSAAARGTALEGEKARAVFESVAKASAVMGLSADQSSGVLLALHQMISKGTVQSEELRGQLGERLPGAFQIAARSMGVTTAELGKMLEMGKVVADDFLPKFALELERSLGDAAKKAAGRLDASVNRVNDAWERMKQNVGDSGVSQFWAGQMNILTDGMGNFNNAVESARASGAGFVGQLAAGAGAVLQFINPINAISYSALEAGTQLKDAEKRLQELKEAGAQQSSNLMLRDAYNHAQRLVDKLREAKAAQDAIAGAKTAASGGDPYNDGSQYGEWKASEKAREEAEKALIELRAGQQGFNKQFLSELGIYEKALEKGAMSASEYAEAVTRLNKKRYESSEAGRAEAKALKAGAGEAKAAEHSYQGLLKSVNEHIAAVQLQMNGSTKLTESQKLQVKYDELLMHGKKGASAATIAMVQAQISALAALEREQKAIRLNVAAYQDYVTQQQELADDYVKQSKAREMVWKSISAGNVALDDQEKRLSIEEQMIGRSSAARTIALAQLEAEIELRKELSEIDSNLDIDEPTRIEARAAARARSARKIALAERKAYVTEWEKTSQLVGQTLADYIMGGGKDAAQYLKRLFATLVLQPVVQYGVSGVMGAAGLGGKPVAGGGTASNTLGLLQSGQGLWSAFSGGTAGTLASGVVGLGQLMGSSFLGELGAGIAAGGQLGIGGTASLIGSAGGTTGAGMAIGAALPWVAGGLAIASLLGGVSFSSRGANHSGGAYSTAGNGVYDLGLRGDALGDFTSRGNAEIASSVQGLVQSTVSAFDYLGKYANDTFKGVDIAAGFAVNGRFSDEDAYAYFRLFDKSTGGLLQSYTQRDGGLGSDANAAWATFSKDLLTSVYGQFMKSDITGWVRDEMAAIDGQVTFQNLAAAAQKIAAIDAAFVSFGKTIDGMADLAGSVQTTLIRTSGGFDALSANLGSYYAGYYSAAEQLEDQVASLTEVFSAYGATLPTTREQFRALVEQQLAAGDAGAEFAAVLLGLNQQFGSVADAWAKDLSSMSASVTGFFADLHAAIEALAADVESSRKDILHGKAVMSAAEIASAIAGTSVTAPSLSAVTSAQAAAALAAASVSAASQPVSAAATAKQSAQAGAASAQSAINSLDAWFAGVQSSFDQFTSYRDWAWSGAGRYSESMALIPVNAQKTAQYQADLASYTSQRQSAVAQLQAQLAALSIASEQAAAAAKKLADAQASLAAAQQAEVQARVNYAAQVEKFVSDAGASVSKLSDLRGEVVSFYEAQAQAVQAMLQSAGNLRSVVDHVRLGQLSSSQTAAELGNRYATDYAMALVTTGSTRAEYVDAMAGNLGSLSEALKAEAITGADWRIETAKLFAQASNAAGLLEGDAEGDDYKDVALGLLGSIDTVLAKLSDSTKSAEQVIADAINSGTQSQLSGLRAIVAALQGKSVPAFASGGMHLGGLRVVGENGPELEATGPSRIWNQSQLAGALGGRGNSARTEKLLQQLIDEQRVQASRQVDLQLQLNKQMQRWDAMGMPETREVSA